MAGAFARGLGEDAGRFGCPLLGGDTVSTPGPLMVSITAFGRLPPGKMVHRSGAKPGDRVVVTGTIGDATLGLDILKGGAVPRPSRGRYGGEGNAGRALSRAAAAERARKGGPRSCQRCDGRIRRSCRGSRKTLQRVRRFRCYRRAEHPVVRGPAALLARGIVGVERIVSGGDDYEILCAIPENRLEAFAGEADRAGVAVTPIGTFIAGLSAPRFLDAQGREIALPRLSYSHF